LQCQRRAGRAGSTDFEAGLADKGYKSRVHRRAARNRSQSLREQHGNTTRSRVRN